MSGDTIAIKRALDASAMRWVRWLDAECCPDDAPAPLGKGEWWLVEINGVPSAYCGWHIEPQDDADAVSTTGFLARAGVLQSARGRGLQKLMIGTRCEAIRKAGLTVATTYTAPWNAASMNSLIACGFKTIKGTKDGFVLWRKPLTRARKRAP